MVTILDWRKQQQIREDIQQMKLNPDLSIQKNTYLLAQKQPNIKYDEVVLCPFCLKSYELSRFRIDKGFRVCPNCNSRLKLSTLSEINNLEKFVKFVFGYRLNGFWDKICLDVEQISRDARFNEWNNRLYSLGLSSVFWDRYKELKGDTYEDF